MENARVLVDLLARKGIRRVVLSPGSRNAPLLLLVARCPLLSRHVIVDERSAAFFALGLARQSGESVALVCTSGTALLDYAPAVAEAYYQGVSLLVISADRPPEWIDQDDGQTIRQRDLLAPVVKASFQLPADGEPALTRHHAARLLNEAINLSRAGHPGPVHVNVPLREPLYDLPAPGEAGRVIEPVVASRLLRGEELDRLQRRLAGSERVMIFAGFRPPDDETGELLARLSARDNVVVLADALANARGGRVIPAIDRLLATLPAGERPASAPDLLLTFGGGPVSRRLKELLREYPPGEHWHVDRRAIPPDTYRSLTLHVEMSPADFLRQLVASLPAGLPSGYAARWQDRRALAAARHEACTRELPWSDLLLFSILLPALPEGCVLHLGNSTPVRYAQFFENIPAGRVDGNRGTCGIEGATSTAAGAATGGGKMTVLVTGDLGFLYDLNALWACPLPPTLRVVVILNGGGGIFRCLPGPSAVEELEEIFTTPSDADIPALARLHRLELFEAANASTLRDVLPRFFSPSPRPALLAIDTREAASGEIFKQYLKYMNNEKLDNN
jgi:2-succinyl-5-enolpyruvyl-6-hydroxy-3-cyclohexene-1-carboxylate synthase